MSLRLFVFAIFITLIGLTTVGLCADSSSPDQIMLADIPFSYGEEKFVERVLAHSKGREPVGLVLSGGSARAFAHIGVLKKMEELGIVPDFIITNSMGSIVGLLYGAGFSPDQISEIIQSTDIGELFKVTFPLEGGIIDVGKFSGLLHNYTGDLDLSELPVPVMVLCEDLKTKRQVRIAEGDFITVMQAAYALPVYFNPVEFGEHLLIDGGITNLVPLDAAYEYTDTVIASTAFYQNPKLDLRNPVTNINVALDIGKSRTGVTQIKKYNPVLIRCNVESFSFMEFGSLPEISSAGYQSAAEMSSELLSLESGGMSPELEAVREAYGIRIKKAEAAYRRLESIPVLNPSLLFTGELNYNPAVRSSRYLIEDIHLTGGFDFSYGYFNAGIFAGGGFQAGGAGGLYPVFDTRVSYDPADSVRLDASYSIKMNPASVDFSNPANPDLFFSSSNAYAGIIYVPVAVEKFCIEMLGSGEASFAGLTGTADSVITAQLKMAAGSNPGSEENYTADLFLGGQISNYSSEFNLDNISWFADLDFKLPVPGTAGILRWDSRGFTRMPVTGDTVRYYLRDGMRTSVTEAEAQNISFVSTALIANLYLFRPAFAEVIMLKEVELGLFGDFGWLGQTAWSTGLSLSADLSLIGLKPLRFDSFAAWDSLSSGFIWGISLTP